MLLPAHARDLVHAALDRGQHPQSQQVDLEKARVGARVLVPLHEVASLHRRGLHRAQVDQRRGRDDHPAGVLGGVARQAVCLRAELDQRAPALRVRAPRADRLGHAAPEVVDVAVHVGRARDALDLAGRQPERLAEIADHALPAVGRERGHQRGALGAVAVVHARDQLLADVAREVEVDVGQRRDLLVQEAPEQQLVADRVDVREAGQVADDRADAGPAAAPGREQAARRARAAHLHRDLARQLEHVVVEQEEARQPELADHAQLLFQPCACLAVLAVVRIALVQPRAAQLGELVVGLGILRAGIAVAEVAREVELDPFREPRGLRDRVGMVGEPRRHVGGGDHHRCAVATALGLGLVEARQQAHRHERVLETRAVRMVGVHVARRNAGHAQPLGELREHAVARAVAAPERALELDAEALAPERGEQPIPVAHGRAVARAAGQAQKPVRVLLHLFERGVRRRALARVRRACARVPRSAAGRGWSSRCGRRRAASGAHRRPGSAPFP